MAYDLLIKNGWVVDGSGLPRYRGDVGVKGGKIVAIGRLREGAKEVIDAEGRVVAPGFVDIHSHGDESLFADPREVGVVDPVTLEIIRGAMNSTIREMELLMERCAMSPFIKEKKDYFVGVFDTRGRIVACHRAKELTLRGVDRVSA